MRLLALMTALTVAAGSLVACRHSKSGGLEACAQEEAAPQAGEVRPREPLLGIVDTASEGAMVGQVDPLTLEPLSRQVRLGEYHDTWSVSPDGSHVAFGISASGKQARIGIRSVDVKAMRVARDIETGIAAVAVGWLTPRRLVASLQDGTVLLDPETGTIIRRWKAFSFADDSAQTRDALVLLFGAPLGSSGRHAVRIAVVDAGGRLRSATLDRVRVGHGGSDRAGLAVDSRGARAYVAGADAPLAEIDLATMRVSYHELEQAKVEPAEALRGQQRRVLWLGDDKIAVVGRDAVVGRGGAMTTRAAGAMLIDTRRWTACSLDEGASAAVLAAGRVLLHSPGRRGSRDQRGIGVRAYDVGRGQTLHLLDGAAVWDIGVAGRHAYVRTPNAIHVVDVVAGKTIARVTRPPALADLITPRPVRTSG